ncbi:MAG TPA: fibronectin type III domain-containing protein [Patescibacteria group bacterium]
MRKIKYLSSLVAGFLLVFLFTPRVLAANLSVSCLAGGPCTITPVSTPLFQETGWVPGDSVSRTITVANQDSSQSCDLVMTVQNPVQSPSNFASVLLSSINSGSTVFISSTLNSIFTGGPISLGTIAAGSSQIYDWNVAFDPNAGNEFQGANTTFDFNLSFTCNPPATSNPNNPGGGGTVQGASTCNDTAPRGAPVLSAISGGDNIINLSWTPVSPVDHYMIEYGTTSGQYIYGATNIGNVTSYSVKALSGNTIYFFRVVGVNGCTGGNWSNEANATTTGAVLAQVAAAGFNILGVKTEATPTPSPTPQSSPSSSPELNVLGASACRDNNYPWWIPLVIQLAASILYIWKRWKDKNWWLILAIGAIISQIIHQILGCNCATGEWCPRYWLLNLIIVFFSVLYYIYQRGSKKVEEPSK